MSRRAAKAAAAPAPVRITITLRIVGNVLDEDVRYSNGNGVGRLRKENMLHHIRDEKQRRGKTYVVPQPDHSEDLGHDSWIVNPGDTVIWTCERPFRLFVDHDLAPCDDIPNAPRDPFGWGGVQASEGNGPYTVTGQVLDISAIQDQMFYKFTVWVDGLAPLDPDGICGVGTGP